MCVTLSCRPTVIEQYQLHTCNLAVLHIKIKGWGSCSHWTITGSVLVPFKTCGSSHCSVSVCLHGRVLLAIMSPWSVLYLSAVRLYAQFWLWILSPPEIFKNSVLPRIFKSLHQCPPTEINERTLLSLIWGINQSGRPKPTGPGVKWWGLEWNRTEPTTSP